jgi:hypothetical protein
MTAADGTVFPIYNGQTSVSLTMSGSGQITDPAYEVNYSSPYDAWQPMNTTHYYHGDLCSAKTSSDPDVLENPRAWSHRSECCFSALAGSGSMLTLHA